MRYTNASRGATWSAYNYTLATNAIFEWLNCA